MHRKALPGHRVGCRQAANAAADNQEWAFVL